MKLENAKALVTGGSEGIGRGIASALVGKGADVVITGRNELALAAAAKEIGAGWIAGDVGVEADVVRTVEEFVARHGRIDILVNNAGFGTFALLVEMSLADLEAVYRTNVFGAFLMAREAAKHFIRQGGGNLINISSTSGTKGGRGSTAYASSKFALRGMTECWRDELRRHDVRVMLVNPSEVQTGLLRQGGRQAGSVEQEAAAAGDRRRDRRHPRDRRPRLRPRAGGVRHQSVLAVSAPATAAPAHSPRRPPSLAAHWRDLKARPGAWVVIARNLVPVVGVFAFGWSRSLVVFDFWFDGLIGLVAILTAIVPRTVRESYKKGDNIGKMAVSAVLAWLILVAFVCLPYWIVLIPLGRYLLDPEMWQQIRSSPGLWATFGGIAGTQIVTAFRKGYGKLPEREMKQALRWDAYLLILKAMGMFVLGLHLPMVLMVPALVVLGTYLELWPASALGAVWGDPSRLHEDPAGGTGDAVRAGAAKENRTSGPRGRRREAKLPP